MSRASEILINVWNLFCLYTWFLFSANLFLKGFGGLFRYFKSKEPEPVDDKTIIDELNKDVDNPWFM